MTAFRNGAGDDSRQTQGQRVDLSPPRQVGKQDLELPFEIPPMHQAIQWHTYRSNDPAIVWLRAAMHKAAAALG